MENMNFTPELLSKAKTAKSAEELIRIAEGEGIQLDEKDAELYFAKLSRSESELADEELEAVAGGCGEKKSPYPLRSFYDSCEHQQDAVWDPM
ncbi:MAG: Nif11-like leader peptide family RiPP precursor, partial [Clostridia bacterium]|nr:Nif11-like leader peptide family RiPP precursor [Clostridia bacterium]